MSEKNPLGAHTLSCKVVPLTGRSKKVKGLSFCNYLQSELRRGYLLENDEERYAARREKVYTFFKIPREIETFLTYGFFQSADSFLFVLTFLPIRFALAFWSLLTRLLRYIIGIKNSTKFLKPAEIVDLLKGTLLIICCYAISYIDTSVLYHMIKTQSTIKLYLFFNMLEITDRLMSAFGQDTLDSLFWTATEPRDRKREHFGVLFHLFVASIYVAVHSVVVLLQALTLNVAINSDNKGLLSIVISNNFIELKGAVFKKFDRNNLLQISCSDVRERFHICVMLFVVVIQTMKEYDWKREMLGILLPDCLMFFGTEVMIDWIKHAFITRFNDIPLDAYRDYTLLISSDLIMCKQKYAYSDHSDLVARRMGFIPLPLGVVIFRVLSSSIKINNIKAYILIFLGFLCLLTFRVLNGIVMLGKACELVNKADTRSRNASECTGTDTKRTTAIPTPLRSRRRTQSREEAPQVETLPVIPPEDSPSSPAKKEAKELANLSFLGDSQSGLMANSMVNLASVGLNQGVTDSLTQAISPDASNEVTPFSFKTSSHEDLSSFSRQDDTPTLQPSFIVTKSCPDFTKNAEISEQESNSASDQKDSLESDFRHQDDSESNFRHRGDFLLTSSPNMEQVVQVQRIQEFYK